VKQQRAFFFVASSLRLSGVFAAYAGLVFCLQAKPACGGTGAQKLPRFCPDACSASCLVVDVGAKKNPKPHTLPHHHHQAPSHHPHNETGASRAPACARLAGVLPPPLRFPPVALRPRLPAPRAQQGHIQAFTRTLQTTFVAGPNSLGSVLLLAWHEEQQNCLFWKATRPALSCRLCLFLPCCPTPLGIHSYAASI